MADEAKPVHVVPNSDRGGWDVTRPNADRASGHFDTQAQAIERGREISRNQGEELVVHGRDGKIREKDSHGRDKFPPKG
jgi:hypothetical protein